jgi:hypothetical protein
VSSADGRTHRERSQPRVASTVVTTTQARYEPAASTPAATEPSTPTAPPTPTPSGPVTAVAIVLQEADGPPGPRVDAVSESLPPQCGGPETTGWDWDAVEAADTVAVVSALREIDKVD